MNQTLAKALKQFGTGSAIGKELAKGFNTAVTETKAIEGPRSREGKYNLNQSIQQAVRMAPETSGQLAALLAERGLQELDDDELMQMLSGGRGFDGLLAVQKKLKGPARKELENVLYEQYRPELAKRLKAGKGDDIPTIDTLLGILELRDADAGWKVVGTPTQTERVWHYLSFDPTAEKDQLPKRDGRRYRHVTLPTGTEDWFKPGFDDSKWLSGKAPIGKGGHPRAPKNLVHRSPWGEGEILMARTTFELDATDHDLYRLRTLCIQGFDVYLNGRKIQSYSWWADPADNRKWPMGPKEAALLKNGTNTIAVYTMACYPSAQKPHWKNEVFGHFNCYIECLDKGDLY